MSTAEDWLGAWDTSWESPTGRYHDKLQIDHLTLLPGQTYEISGRGEKYTIHGEVSFVLGGNWTIQGGWDHVIGSSGGKCPFGKLSLTLASDSKNFVGKWSYCSDSPWKTGEGWSWSGRKV